MSIATLQSSPTQGQDVSYQVQRIIHSKIQTIEHIRRGKLHFLEHQDLPDERLHLLVEVYYYIELTSHALYLLQILKSKTSEKNANLILDLLSDDKYLTISEERLFYLFAPTEEKCSA